jgi:hypothetical protein
VDAASLWWRACAARGGARAHIDVLCNLAPPSTSTQGMDTLVAAFGHMGMGGAQPSIAAPLPAVSDTLRHNFISSLIVAASNGFAREVEPFLALSHETWDEEILWDAVKDVPPSPIYRRTRLMHAAKVGDVKRLRWLLARGARVGLTDAGGCTALCWASANGREEAVQILESRGAAYHAKAEDSGPDAFVEPTNDDIPALAQALASQDPATLLDATVRLRKLLCVGAWRGAALSAAHPSFCPTPPTHPTHFLFPTQYATRPSAR